MLSDTFLRRYARFLTIAVRCFGTLFGVGGMIAIVGAIAEPEGRGLAIAIGVLGVLTAVGTLVAKPVTLAYFRGVDASAMGPSHVSQLSTNSAKQPAMPGTQRSE